VAEALRIAAGAACGAIATAIGMFVGTPFAIGLALVLGVAIGFYAPVVWLDQLVRERRTELALDCGIAEELVGELEQRVRTEPYRERGWEQLALALYRAGRQADEGEVGPRPLQDLVAGDPDVLVQVLQLSIFEQRLFDEAR